METFLNSGSANTSLNILIADRYSFSMMAISSTFLYVCWTVRCVMAYSCVHCLHILPTIIVLKPTALRTFGAASNECATGTISAGRRFNCRNIIFVPSCHLPMKAAPAQRRRKCFSVTMALSRSTPTRWKLARMSLPRMIHKLLLITDD